MPGRGNRKPRNAGGASSRKLGNIQPRVPSDVGLFFLGLALDVRRILVKRGDSREIGMGEVMRLYLIDAGDLPRPSDEDTTLRLEAFRVALAAARAAAAESRRQTDG